MSEWWRDLSSRERLLIAIAGVLAGVLFISLAIISPLEGWRDDAARKAKSARDGYELTAAAAAVSGDRKSSGASATPLRQAVIGTAGAAGVELVRIGAENNNQLEIQLAPANPETLFNWFTELQANHGVRVVFADITRGESGLVNPQVLVFEQKQ